MEAQDEVLAHLLHSVSPCRRTVKSAEFEWDEMNYPLLPGISSMISWRLVRFSTIRPPDPRMVS